jgi:hypothetical protein
MPTLLRRLGQLEATAARQRRDPGVLDALRADPSAVMRLTGMTPDPWQQEILTYLGTQSLLLTSRQTGKSTTCGALAVRLALTKPSLCLLTAPCQRQSQEIYRKALDFYHALGRPVPALAETKTALELANGSRVVSLPGDSETIRSFSAVALVVVDEATYCEDALIHAVSPMLATSGGKLILAATPAGQRGLFYEKWVGPEPWQRIRVMATECPRLPADFLAQSKRSMGARWYAQEFQCDFAAALDSVFSPADIGRAVTDLRPIF